ncbi:MAG: hypothetical protein JW918_10960 [Anaerolineae bacterium]|nr:hypothetical protein [Anaerolineae bacterium]
MEDEFWVDVYLDPTTPPTAVNQTWRHVGDHGIVSAHSATSYGGVMENHEIVGGPYNNITGPVTSTDASDRGAGFFTLTPWPAKDLGLPPVGERVFAR